MFPSFSQHQWCYWAQVVAANASLCYFHNIHSVVCFSSHSLMTRNLLSFIDCLIMVWTTSHTYSKKLGNICGQQVWDPVSTALFVLCLHVSSYTWLSCLSFVPLLYYSHWTSTFFQDFFYLCISSFLIIRIWLLGLWSALHSLYGIPSSNKPFLYFFKYNLEILYQLLPILLNYYILWGTLDIRNNLITFFFVKI